MQIEDFYVGQALKFRTYADLLYEYSHREDPDGDLDLREGYIFKQTSLQLQDTVCHLYRVSGDYIYVTFSDEVLNDEHHDHGFVYHYFTAVEKLQLELTCSICSTVDEIYVLEHMKHLLDDAYDCDKVFVEGKLYYKIAGYYYPSSAVKIIESEESVPW